MSLVGVQALTAFPAELAKTWPQSLQLKTGTFVMQTKAWAFV